MELTPRRQGFNPLFLFPAFLVCLCICTFCSGVSANQLRNNPDEWLTVTFYPLLKFTSDLPVVLYPLIILFPFVCLGTLFLLFLAALVVAPSRFHPFYVLVVIALAVFCLVGANGSSTLLLDLTPTSWLAVTFRPLFQFFAGSFISPLFFVLIVLIVCFVGYNSLKNRGR